MDLFLLDVEPPEPRAILIDDVIYRDNELNNEFIFKAA
jgi:hypothetical protein